MTCALCGTRATSEAEALSWTTSVERGRTLHHCVTCSREHLRAIEGKFDSDWW
ncbi:hypothetical protein GCM10007231_29650 [Nocardioides daphniae]|uniref:Uncharacterized protein n=1 Tax=Nocardioides daphniae TaxID=402297 RepID=A0ABQ1QKM9_9ACTN|nr:hypothetical protein GCM10007231_29650 [Nocardioides daphniae]